MDGLLKGLSLETVCESAHCPNIGRCFTGGTATFLILGNVCSRHCTFCAVKKGHPTSVDKNEPRHLLEAVTKLGLDYIVITSVTRDDLPDGGAAQFAKTIKTLHENREDAIVEVLIPDFLDNESALRTVVEAWPEVINHNIETVARLYPEARPEANYRRSLGLLSRVKSLDPEIVTKSGLMLGLGETKAEIIGAMSDLREASCDLLTIGQYLSPSSHHHPVVRFISPEEFAEFADVGWEMGFGGIASAPLARSSFQANELYARAKKASPDQIKPRS